MLLQPTNVQISRVVSQPDEVHSRLLDLHPDLGEKLLLEANMRGYEARSEAATLAHAPTAAGTFHWHQFVASLRMTLAQKDWKIKNHKNCPFVISPDNTLSILVMTGDADTGKERGHPANQAEKGAVLSEAVERNGQYELFENNALSVLERGKAGTQLWVLLYHVSMSATAGKEIRTELSLPSKFERKRIVGWSERIILSKIEPDAAPNIQHELPTGPIDVPVERRQAG